MTRGSRQSSHPRGLARMRTPLSRVSDLGERVVQTAKGRRRKRRRRKNKDPSDSFVALLQGREQEEDWRERRAIDVYRETDQGGGGGRLSSVQEVGRKKDISNTCVASFTSLSLST